MQHWEIYLKWNERLFNEMYSAFEHGRASKDPSISWYEGEIMFFDKYVIPVSCSLIKSIAFMVFQTPTHIPSLTPPMLCTLSCFTGQLAKKLDECRVFGVSSDECLNYANQNRKLWAIRGDEIIKEFLQRYKDRKTTAAASHAATPAASAPRAA